MLTVIGLPFLRWLDPASARLVVRAAEFHRFVRDWRDLLEDGGRLWPAAELEEAA